MKFIKRWKDIIYAEEKGIIFEIHLKPFYMKTSRIQENKQSKQGLTNKPIPEIRDNMDSGTTVSKTKIIQAKPTNRGTKKVKNKIIEQRVLLLPLSELPLLM